ncbi:MAG: hypothetical protein E6Q83_03735 [Thiothrix sp.]|nr:MAG: hypothetical protein E6Q83_03735 [Thiothrix sp.]
MNNKLLVIGALLISLNVSAAEIKKPVCKITDEMKLAISMMCSLEPNPSSCEAEAIKTLEQEYNCKAGE